MPLIGALGAIPLFVIVVIAFWLFASIKVLNEYERAVVFRLGRLLPEAKGPGLTIIWAPIDRMVRVSLRTVVHDVPPQDVITRDNVSVKLNAVVYYRVLDPSKAVVEVEQYHYATSQLSQTTLRSVLGQVELRSFLEPVPRVQAGSLDTDDSQNNVLLLRLVKDLAEDYSIEARYARHRSESITVNEYYTKNIWSIGVTYRP